MVQFVKSFAGVKPWTVQYQKKIEKDWKGQTNVRCSQESMLLTENIGRVDWLKQLFIESL